MMNTIFSLMSVYLIISANAADKNNSRQSSSCNRVSSTNIRVFGKPGPYLFPGDTKIGTKDSGFFVEFLDGMTNLTNLTYTLTLRPDLAYGIKDPNGSWDNSLIRALLENQADLIGSDVTINSDRDDAVDFLIPVIAYELRIMVNKKYGLNSEVQYLVRKGTADVVFLKNSANASVQAIYANVLAGMPDSLVQDDKAGLAKLLTGNFAFMTESSALDKFVAKYPDQLSILDYSLGDFFETLAVQQDSPFRDKLNLAIIQLSESGWLQTLMNKYNL